MADSFVVRVLKRVLSRSLRERMIDLLWTRLPTRAAILLCRLFRRHQSASGYANILVVRLDGMGDCVMTLPLLQELRRCYPASTISVVVADHWNPLIEAEPSVDRVLPLQWFSPRFLPKSARRLYSCLRLYWRSLRGNRYDLVINPRWDADCYLATMLCALTLAPITVGYEDGTSPWKFRQNAGFQEAYNVVIEAGPLCHEVLRNLNVLRTLGHEPKHIAPSIAVSEERRRWAARWMGQSFRGQLIVFGLPASAAKKRWEASRYIDLIHLLRQAEDVSVVLIADDTTLPTAETVENACSGTRIALSLPFADVTALIALANVYVGCDSGLAHVSAALQRPTVALFSHPLGGDLEHFSSPERFRPYGEKSFVIRPPGRPGCRQICVSDEAHCILDIDPREVAALITAQLSLQRQSRRTLPAAGAAELPDGFNEIIVVEPQMEWI